MGYEVAVGAPAKYPWRETMVGETFQIPYCPRCAKALVAQAEKSTGRKFEITSKQTSVTIKRQR
jgi:hypothetical protein